MTDESNEAMVNHMAKKENIYKRRFIEDNFIDNPIKEKVQVITLIKGEEKGLMWIFVLYIISWVLLLSKNFLMAFIGWVTMGMIGASLFLIMKNLLKRNTEKGVVKD